MSKESTTNSTTAIGEASAEQIAQWKEAHKDVYEIYAIHPDTKKTHKGYLRKPERKEISYATQIAKNNPMGFNESILRDCWLAGSMELRTNDAMFMGASGQLDEIIQIADAGIKKL